LHISNCFGPFEAFDLRWQIAEPRGAAGVLPQCGPCSSYTSRGTVVCFARQTLDQSLCDGHRVPGDVPEPQISRGIPFAAPKRFPDCRKTTFWSYRPCVRDTADQIFVFYIWLHHKQRGRRCIHFGSRLLKRPLAAKIPASVVCARRTCGIACFGGPGNIFCKDRDVVVAALQSAASFPRILSKCEHTL
jgi:hypothetical protein